MSGYGISMEAWMSFMRFAMSVTLVIGMEPWLSQSMADDVAGV